MEDLRATQSFLTVFVRPSDSRGPWTFPSLPSLLLSFLQSECGVQWAGKSSSPCKVRRGARRRGQMGSSPSCGRQTLCQPGRIGNPTSPTGKPCIYLLSAPPFLPPSSSSPSLPSSPLPSGLCIFRAYSDYVVMSASSSLLEMETYGNHLPFTE